MFYKQSELYWDCLLFWNNFVVVVVVVVAGAEFPFSVCDVL
jgi:hypothetical protein